MPKARGRCHCAYDADHDQCDTMELVTVTDQSGQTFRGCQRHATRRAALLDGCTVTPLAWCPGSVVDEIVNRANWIRSNKRIQGQLALAS